MADAVTPNASQVNPVVIFDNVKYDVIAGPDDATPLVQLVRTAALQTIEVDKLVSNLKRTDDLLFIAACGVAGLMHPTTQQALSAQVMGLQYKLRTNTGEIGSALLSFGESARNMLSVLRGALKDLYSLHEADAVTRLARCESVATEMAHSAGKIEGNFQSLAEEAAAVLRLTSETRNLHRHERPAAQQGQRDINARDESIKATRAALEQQMRRVQTLHQEAKAAQATADGRVSSQSMVSHLAMAFGGGIAAEPALTMESLKAGSELGAALAETRTNYPVRNEEETKAPTQDARPLTEEAKKKDAATAKQTYEDETASPGRSAALDAYAATAASYAQEKFKYLDMLMDLQEQEREALNAMAHNALELGAAKDNEEVEDAAVVSLHHAVVTLNQIVVILAERKRILTQMATECARLAKVDLRTVIEEHMKRSREHRIVAYNEPGFQVQLLVVAAQWRALQLVASAFRSAIQTAYAKMGETYTKNPTIEEARQLVPILGTALAQEVTVEISSLNERSGREW
ncbi:MAG: hypothetical protein IPH26_08715 [Sterolibacteriaceae bacterium]|uniref:Uncharacterized protein n=1 Tax=Candidatus Methylophosphatis roskildensis TaxID=2899263 RepID=A0A9D7HR19_9PROT|nr:hypothetical protein [Candidatus Methylophosphatis roskildensis]MBK7237580.1 hypothetical protein [Sterolibacteriaceae bacterium]